VKKRKEIFENFEGNATGFRFLIKNFPLTAATLGTFTKYPCTASNMSKDFLHTKKNGVYQADKDYMTDVMFSCGLQSEEKLWKRHPFSYLVEASDDICYRVIDPEDAVRLGILSKDTVLKIYQEITGEKSINDLTEQRSLIIKTAIAYATTTFKSNSDAILHGTFAGGLLDKWAPKDKLNSLRSIYNEKSVVKIEIAGYTILKYLMEIFVPAMLVGKGLWKKAPRKGFYEHIFKLIPDEYKNLLHTTCYHAILSVADYVMGMTDNYATRLCNDLKGHNLL